MPSIGSDLELRTHKVCAPAAAALTTILTQLQIGDTDVFYAVRSRAKSVKNAIGKVERKRVEGKTNYEPEDITDIVGIRIVTLFREDVIEVVKVFLRMINHEAPYTSHSSFEERGLLEKIVYTTATVGDPEAITSRLRAVFETMGYPLKEEEIQQVATGYSSTHLVARVLVEYDGEAMRVPVEIQIRNVFEDAWGEIDHKIRYSLNRSRSRQSKLESWQPHLNVMKTFADGCAQYAGVIKNQALDPQTQPRFEMAAFVPVETMDEIFAQIGPVSDSLRSQFEIAYKLSKEAVEAVKASDRVTPESRELFAQATKAFEATLPSLDQEKFESPHAKNTAYFFCKMEIGFSLLSSEVKSNIDAAIKIYSELQEQYPKSVIVHYRYAQALQKLGEFDAAEKMYVRAEALLNEDMYVPRGHWLHSTVPQQYGYLLWTKSLAIPTSGGRVEKLELLRKAYELTTKAFRFAKPNSTRQTRAANNLLYYAIEYCGLWREGDSSVQIPISEIKPYADILEKKLDLATAAFAEIGWLDTLCRAYAHLGPIPSAVLAAERIEHLLSAENDSQDSTRATESPSSYYAVISNLNVRERDMLDHALWVLRKYGPGPERGTNEPDGG